MVQSQVDLPRAEYTWTNTTQKRCASAAVAKHCTAQVGGMHAAPGAAHLRVLLARVRGAHLGPRGLAGRAVELCLPHLEPRLLTQCPPLVPGLNALQRWYSRTGSMSVRASEFATGLPHANAPFRGSHWPCAAHIPIPPAQRRKAALRGLPPSYPPTALLVPWPGKAPVLVCASSAGTHRCSLARDSLIRWRRPPAPSLTAKPPMPRTTRPPAP